MQINKKCSPAYLLLLVVFLGISVHACAEQTDLEGPAGTHFFGAQVSVLSNGNFVVVDDSWGAAAQGAVYLYRASGELISTLTGGSDSDHVGGGGIFVLSNGDFVVVSPSWSDPAGEDTVGAVTLMDGVTGLSGVVTAENSLVGSSRFDSVGSGGITELANGNVVIVSQYWNNGSAQSAGAVTFVDVNIGLTGVVSTSNSLVGTHQNDFVGFGRITPLINGNFVVSSPRWSNPPATSVGAVTWVDGSAGLSGEVTPQNSLVGDSQADQVGGMYAVVALSNGNYVVPSPFWDNGLVTDVGAATWGDGLTGITGTVSPANSLVGSTQNDWVGSGLIALSNGNYVVLSDSWNNDTTPMVGAATWANGESGLVGIVSPENSLIGSTSGDRVGLYESLALTNGNYVVSSPYWDNGPSEDVGASTWANGATGLVGIVSTTNSLVGSTPGDQVGNALTALTNGNYVTASSTWDNGAISNVGAATWCDGNAACIGAVSTNNSLVGSSVNDKLERARALANGNYVVPARLWNNGNVADAGALAWGDGVNGTVGLISESNSLVGTSAGDRVGVYVRTLANGNYVALSYFWTNGAMAGAGAVTWGDGAVGVVGPVSAANSFVGENVGDQVGLGGVYTFSDGNYAFASSYWNSNMSPDHGAVTLARGDTPLTGSVDAQNSILGRLNACCEFPYAYDPHRERLVVGRYLDNLVSLLSFSLFAGDFDP